VKGKVWLNDCVLVRAVKKSDGGKKLGSPAGSHSMRRNLVTQELLLLFTCNLDVLWKLIF
jgi:hypothetical protein